VFEELKTREVHLAFLEKVDLEQQRDTLVKELNELESREL